MSDDDTNVVSFRGRPTTPVPPPPPLPPGPAPRIPVLLAAGPAATEERPAGPAAWPGLPSVREMAPPLALRMPGLPGLAPERTEDAGDSPATEPDSEQEGDGEFVPPDPEDPQKPTVRDMLAVCRALVTALGVAAAQGMWHRARQRAARADRARDAADRATGGRKSRRDHGDDHGPRTRSRHEASRTRRPGGGHGGGHGDGWPKGHRASHKQPGEHKQPKGPKGRGDGPSIPAWVGRAGVKAIKAARDGHRRRKDKKEKTPKAPKLATTTPTKGPRPATARRVWRASPKSSGGRKRWKRPAPTARSAKPTKAAGTTRVRRVLWRAPKSKSPRRRWGHTGHGTGRRTWKSTATSTRSRSTGAGSRPKAGQQSAHATPPPPPPGWQRMRPPPGADRRTWVTAEWIGTQPRPRPQSKAEPAVLAGAPAAGRPALPAGATAPATVSATSSPAQQGARFVSTPSTQYADADLTIGDVIDGDADMATEITEGVAEARATAEGCDLLLTRLEALHAEVVDLRVPGVLEGLLVLLMERTATVKAKAEAIAETLPAAAEAISIAGANAEIRHKPLADAVRDAGHIRPAERQYHDE